ncbi:hypothetical protein Enr17x_15750 [Gimesia fumaroli]|uniref:Uncharacterized protein n=1 Tax=Gimesia fumaroli TaxID=2527976 RepID=A0A518I8W8_9PLAN|nr:hypothetical protein Enr17x_15750 [Gimesia fumaroli]
MKRFYCGRMLNDSEPQGVVQVEHSWFKRNREREPITMPESILRLAHEEYAAQGHSQSFERIQERGGFGVMEVAALLADRVQRLEASNDDFKQ